MRVRVRVRVRENESEREARRVVGGWWLVVGGSDLPL